MPDAKLEEELAEYHFDQTLEAGTQTADRGYMAPICMGKTHSCFLRFRQACGTGRVDVSGM